MAEMSIADKMHIQMLREQGFGAKTITAMYPAKNWSVQTVLSICQRVDQRGSAVERKLGSGRPKTARSDDNIVQVSDLICSQESQPGTSNSTRQIASEIGISERSVRRIAKVDLKLTVFKRMPAQVINAATKAKRLERSSKRNC